MDLKELTRQTMPPYTPLAGKMSDIINRGGMEAGDRFFESLSEAEQRQLVREIALLELDDIQQHIFAKITHDADKRTMKGASNN